MLMASKRKRPVDIEQRAQPTPERLRQADGAIEIGDDRQGSKTLTMRDSPLERARNRRAISEEQYISAMKYYNHWWCSGLSGGLHSIELDRIFSGDPSNFSGMAKTENEAFHRQRYRDAVQKIGIDNSEFLEDVVCKEMTLTEAGQNLKWNHDKSRIVAATEKLRTILDLLRSHWGLP